MFVGIRIITHKLLYHFGRLITDPRSACSAPDFLQTNPKQLEFAKSLYADISLKFPHLKLWPFHDNPHGPHTVGMFEVDVKNPLDFGTMVSFLALNRGPLSVLVHPHRRGPEAESEARPGRDIKDHTQYAFWMGERHHLDFEKMVPPTSAATTAMAQPAAL